MNDASVGFTFFQEMPAGAKVNASIGLGSPLPPRSWICEGRLHPRTPSMQSRAVCLHGDVDAAWNLRFQEAGAGLLRAYTSAGGLPAVWLLLVLWDVEKWHFGCVEQVVGVMEGYMELMTQILSTLLLEGSSLTLPVLRSCCFVEGSNVLRSSRTHGFTAERRCTPDGKQ